jgi:integrase
VDEYLLWLSKRAPKKLLGQALDEFLAEKEKNRGPSHQNVRTLRSHLNALQPLREKVIADISAADLPAIEGAARTRRNKRAAWVTFWKWCELNEYLPHGEKTAPERLAKPIIKRKIPVTYTPAELKILLANVTPEYLPWLACISFSGVRTDEASPAPGGEKSPLHWSDFHWDRDIIIIRPETDKNGQRRIVPIQPVLRNWLWPIKKESGRLTPLRSPWSAPRSGPSETSRLGKLIGGWKANALRHSFISYRAAQKGLAQAAMEAGNSESEARKSYNDAKSPAEAEEWFGATRETIPPPR